MNRKAIFTGVFTILVALALSMIIFMYRHNDKEIKVLDGDGSVFKGYDLPALESMAYNYYEAKYNYAPGNVVANYDENDSEIVHIHLYDSFEDHDTTIDWYTVNKYTGEGTNVLGEKINLFDTQNN